MALSIGFSMTITYLCKAVNTRLIMLFFFISVVFYYLQCKAAVLETGMKRTMFNCSLGNMKMLSWAGLTAPLCVPQCLDMVWTVGINHREAAEPQHRGLFVRNRDDIVSLADLLKHQHHIFPQWLPSFAVSSWVWSSFIKHLLLLDR